MTLNHGQTTRLQRFTMATLAAFTATLGIIWVTQDTARTAVPALEQLRDVWPIEATGLVLLGVGLLVAATPVVRSLPYTGLALGAGFLAYLLLAGLIAWPLASGSGSYSAPLWPLLPAALHLGTLISVAHQEGEPHP